MLYLISGGWTRSLLNRSMETDVLGGQVWRSGQYELMLSLISVLGASAILYYSLCVSLS